jgi:hypothetical protein
LAISTLAVSGCPEAVVEKEVSIETQQSSADQRIQDDFEMEEWWEGEMGRMRWWEEVDLETGRGDDGGCRVGLAFAPRARLT